MFRFLIIKLNSFENLTNRFDPMVEVLVNGITGCTQTINFEIFLPSLDD